MVLSFIALICSVNQLHKKINKPEFQGFMATYQLLFSAVRSFESEITVFEKGCIYFPSLLSICCRTVFQRLRALERKFRSVDSIDISV